jgi:hypothetical protein
VARDMRAHPVHRVFRRQRHEIDFSRVYDIRDTTQASFPT